MKPLFLCLLLLCGKALPLFPESAALFAESAASFPEKPCIAPDTALHPAPDSLSAGPDTVRYRRLGAAVVSGGRAGRFLDRRAAPGKTVSHFVPVPSRSPDTARYGSVQKQRG